MPEDVSHRPRRAQFSRPGSTWLVAGPFSASVAGPGARRRSDAGDGAGGVESTDRRVAEERPVTPAFLLAALLWPAYSEEMQALLAEGLDPAAAQQREIGRAHV